MKFYFKTVLKIFTEISEKNNVERNAIKMKVSYSALYEQTRKLENLGLLEIKKVGRENRIKFTERGRKLVILFKEINSILNEREGNECCGERKNGK
jgi:predicted transcriptional regulator